MKVVVNLVVSIYLIILLLWPVIRKLCETRKYRLCECDVTATIKCFGLRFQFYEKHHISFLSIIIILIYAPFAGKRNR